MELGDGFNSEIIHILLFTHPQNKVIGHCSIFVETLKVGTGTIETVKLLEGEDGVQVCGEIMLQSIYKCIRNIDTFTRREDDVAQFEGIISPAMRNTKMKYDI